jgi:hypothetical protein
VRAAILAIVIAAAPTVAAAAGLPASLHGTWRVANPADDQCRRDVAAKDAAEGHMIVTAAAVAHYESHCRIASVKPTRLPNQERTSVVADLNCAGEGMRWSTRTLFHLETVAGKKLVAVTTLSHSDTRDAGGRRVKVPNLPTTTIYTECQ